MAWVRIHDGAMTHPKVIGLSDKAFRLWIWGLSYSQQHLTNGAIPQAAIPARVARASNDLVDAKLWDTAAKGYTVHDYLHWNDSRDAVLKKRTDAKDRMSAARDRSSQYVRANHLERTSPEVLRRVGLEDSSGSSEKDSGEVSIEQRAGDFVEKYGELYTRHRHGAKWLRRKPNLEWVAACDLCRQWDDERLEKMVVIFLTTDDDWIGRTDRGFTVFVSRATWCDERLSAWEASNKVSA